MFVAISESTITASLMSAVILLTLYADNFNNDNFLFSLTNILGQTEKPKLLITHLTGDFYIFTTYKSLEGMPFPANGMYLVAENGVVMFDTPWDTTQFQPLLDSIKFKYNKSVLMCIATHFHEDRTGGLEYYREQGIKTYTTKQTDSLSKERGEKRAEYLIKKDTLFIVGQYIFQPYYPGQGHSPDNIVIWFDKQKILYGGYMIKSTKADDLGYTGDANIKEWGNSIKNIQTKFKEPKYIVTGHQDWISTKSLEHTLELIQQNKNYR